MSAERVKAAGKAWAQAADCALCKEGEARYRERLQLSEGDRDYVPVDWDELVDAQRVERKAWKALEPAVDESRGQEL
jgi:hypothetical protein